MSVVRVFKPENRLKPILADPTAPTVAELAAAAERQVAKLKPTLRACVGRHRDALTRLAELAEAEMFAQGEAIGAAALGIAEVAGACDMAAAGEAARGVYAVVCALRADGMWRPDVLNAHVAALLLLSGDPAPDAAETRGILERLSGMRAFVGIPT